MRSSRSVWRPQGADRAARAFDGRTDHHRDGDRSDRAGRDWFKIQAKADSPDTVGDSCARVFIYDEIGYWGTTAADFVVELGALDVDRIDLRLNSPGGEVYDGIAIHNALRNHRARVDVTVDGLAASIASVIAMAGDTVRMGDGSEMMIHKPWGMCIGDDDDMLDMAAGLARVCDNIARFYARRAGGAVEDWRAVMKAETWYSADEAVAAGLADALVSSTGESKSDGSRAAWDLSVFRYAGRQCAPEPLSRASVSTAIVEPDDPIVDSTWNDVVSRLESDPLAALRGTT